jgi:hypothetical protein
MTGVMNELTKPFVEASIPVFALSSWYVLHRLQLIPGTPTTYSSLG